MSDALLGQRYLTILSAARSREVHGTAIVVVEAIYHLLVSSQQRCSGKGGQTMAMMELTHHYTSTKLAKGEAGSARTALPSRPIAPKENIESPATMATQYPSSVGSRSPAAPSPNELSDVPSPSIHGSDRVASHSPSPLDTASQGPSGQTKPAQTGQVCR